MSVLRAIRSTLRSFRWLQAALLVAAAWFVFSPSFHGDWLWDDFEIRENPLLRDWSGLGKIWYAAEGPDYFPLKDTALWVQWHLWHENLLGYHLVNVGLHLLGAFLLWHLLKKLGVRHAWIGGLLFVVHPLAVGSVAWVSELKNTLSFPLLLGAMIAYMDYDALRCDALGWNALPPTRLSGPGVNQTRWGQRVPPGNRSDRTQLVKHYIASVLLFLAAMLCKSSVAMFPFVVLLYCWWKRGRICRRDIGSGLPFFAISLVLGLVTVWFQKYRAIANWRLPAGTLASRLSGAGLAIKFYFLKCIFPRHLMPIYPGWPEGSSLLFRLMPWLVLAAATGWLWAERSRLGRHALFGLGFFVLNLIPVLGFIPMAFLHLAPVADHFAYVSLAGLIGLAVAGLGAALDRLAPLTLRPAESGLPPSGRGPVRGLLIAAAATICLLFAVESRGYARNFINQETLWADNLRLNPRSPGVLINLAFVEHHDGQLDQAIGHYRQAIALAPDDPEPEDELADVLIEQNKASAAAPYYENAIAHYERALALDPSLLGTRRSLAKLLAKSGQTTAAIAAIRGGPRATRGRSRNRKRPRQGPDGRRPAPGRNDALRKIAASGSALRRGGEQPRLRPRGPGTGRRRTRPSPQRAADRSRLRRGAQ